MSHAPAPPVDRTAPAAWILVAAGLAAMLVRPQLVALTGSSRVLALGAVYTALLAGCLLVPIAPDRDRPGLSPWAGTLIGLGAVGLAALVSGPVVRMPFAAWALPLSVLAAVAEEALFRRVAYGWLARWGVLVAIIGWRRSWRASTPGPTVYVSPPTDRHGRSYRARRQDFPLRLVPIQSTSATESLPRAIVRPTSYSLHANANPAEMDAPRPDQAKPGDHSTWGVSREPLAPREADFPLFRTTSGQILLHCDGLGPADCIG